MMGMLNPVSFDHFNLIADFYREKHVVNGIALFDLFQMPGSQLVKAAALSKLFSTASKNLYSLLRSHKSIFK